MREERSDFERWELGRYIQYAVEVANYNSPGFHDPPKKPAEYMPKPMMFYRNTKPKYFADPDDLRKEQIEKQKNGEVEVNERDQEILAAYMHELVREGEARARREAELRGEEYVPPGKTHIGEPAEPLEEASVEVIDDAVQH